MNPNEPTFVLADSYYGVPVTQNVLAHASVAGTEPARWSVAAYVGRNRCEANNDTCLGPRAKGTQYCVGHLRSMKKV